MKKIFLAILLVFGFTINAFAFVDVETEVNDKGIVTIKGESNYKREPVAIKIYDDFRKYYINQDTTDRDGDFEFEFKLEKGKEYDGEINIKGRKEEFSFSTEKKTGEIVQIYIKGYEGIIISKTEVEIKEGDTAIDVTKRILDEKDIEYVIENDGYIKSIDGQAEFDKGAKSGWMFSVNGEFPEIGPESVDVKKGDYIKWLYTNNLGEDVGGLKLIFEDPQNDIEELINEANLVLHSSKAKDYEIINVFNEIIDSLDNNFNKMKKDQIKDIVCYINETSKLLEKASRKVDINTNSSEVMEINLELLKYIEKSMGEINNEVTKKEVKETTSKIISIGIKIIEEIESINEIEEFCDDIIQTTFNVINEFEDKNANELRDDIVTLIDTEIEKYSYYKLSKGSVEEIKNNITVNVNTEEFDKTVKKVLDSVSKMERKLSKNNIKLDKSIEKKIVIDIPNKDKEQIEIKLLSDIMHRALSKGIDKIKIKSKIAVFNIDPDTFKEISKEDISLKVRKISDNDIDVIDFDICINGKHIKKTDKSIEISIPYENDVKDVNKVSAFYLQDGGSIQTVGGHYNEQTKTVTFKTNSIGKYFTKESIKEFYDLENVKWAKNEVEIMASRGIINGRENNNFRPNDNITRAEFAALITRMLNYEDSNNELPFEDVNKNDWYYKSVSSAYTNGLIKGKSKNIFDPNGNITRQEMAKIIANVLKSKGYKKATSKELNGFKDKENIASWAKESVGLSAREGIITGMDNKTFAPNEKATRAQAAVMLYRLYKLTIK